MSQQRLYLALQCLTLSDGNWNALVAAMKTKGANQAANACLRNHWRLSLDSTIYIFEAEFNSDNVDIPSFINWMSSEFGVPAQDIGEQTGYTTIAVDGYNARFSTFSYPAGVTNRFRLGVFGFVQGEGWPSYIESHEAVLQYLASNIANWETEPV